ncbi:hypothetical protein RHGRI_023300 [Rhododendron griersonianum]|uniref:Uncharacterized protein n=1 Tax=Rhododendron griersonianum TaxID=479676 RepID=A0AAV6J6D2_9ERIC|nr:hypothetical protein RHGRI_023300 [Rhododendron griersonianum]
MSKKESRKESKLIRCIKSPIRALGKARDFYVKSMTRWAGKVEYGGVMGGAPTAQVSSLPKSFSVSSSKSSGDDDDLRDLIRAASTRSLESKVQLELLRRQPAGQAGAVNGVVVPRSQSVAIGRIEEDKCYEFENDHMGKVNTEFVPRSKSYAVTRRANGRF